MHKTGEPEARQQKRTAFTESKTRRWKPAKLVGLAVFGLAAVAIYGAFSAGDRNSRATEAKDAKVIERTETTTTRDIVIPLSEIQGAKAKFFKYTTSDGSKMRFFAIRSSDGVYRAALDACDLCYRGKQGYYQDGDDMVCRKCGQRFHSALVNDVTGGCNPVALERTVKGDKLVIKASELESRKEFF